MDGKTLLYQLRQALQEGSGSTWIDTRTSYDFLYEAASELTSIIRPNTKLYNATSVAGNNAYDLPADFLCLHMKNDLQEYVIKYNDGNSSYWPTFRPYENIYVDNNTSNQAIPDSFTIIDKSSLPSVISGTTTAANTATNGEIPLTDSSATFVGNVAVGDYVHNVTDGAESTGVVLQVNSNTSLQTALFGGTSNVWGNGHSYSIIPLPRKQVFVDPPSSTSGHTITIPYVPRPDPVYAGHRMYRFNPQYGPALVKYAAWLYKYRDREPNYGDNYYKYWQEQLRKAQMNENRLPSRTNWKVNFQKRSYGDRSYR